jgi:hypothetical protein
MSEQDATHESNEAGGLAMPAEKPGASAVQGLGSAAPKDGAPLPPPPSFGRQIAQLVIIPAAIVVVCLIFAAIFGGLVGQPDSLEDQLARLRQPSGLGGGLPAGAQDPRYKDRCLAAYSIAAMIPSIESAAERRQLSDDLIKILETSVQEHEAQLQAFILLALGRLGQPGGLDAALARAESKHELVRQAVIGAVLNWSDVDAQQARRGLPALTAMLRLHSEPLRSQAAAAMSKIARPDDADVIIALHETMASTGWDYRDGTNNPNDPPRQYTYAVWNAAVSLAVLGDDKGAAFVADTLLNRAELAKLHGDVTGRDASTLSPQEQEKVMAGVLQQAAKIKDQRVWRRIESLAKDDPSVVIRKAASVLLEQRDK